ncbi:serine hydrolase domain-containing protein [Chryseobacterium oryctis]|uniref:Beta-lactamase family protein n=1 Tax=Chryseobacterium oryctis TaxID=2952618 RepID=A0ABT3HSX1_9FLAO|nr:serine hydrolase domain-containing protein [Chryseobacterium oryctis]MCW3162775.1 beta-lactamase family protein [Chryseobacterium oryctis]
MKPLFLIFTASIVLSCNSTKVVEDKQLSQKLDSLIQVKNPREFNGTIAISKDGNNIYKKAFGFSNFDNKTKLKIDDKFSTMSIAKQITATLVMLEVEKGTINLNQPIKTYLKDMKYDWANKVTVHHLLNNSSGIDAWELKENLLFEPGTQFKYSNIGYATLGRILENATGKRYGELVTALFAKYGMKNSFYPDQQNQNKIVNSYAISKDETKLVEKFPFSQDLFPGSHLLTTTEDLTQWNYLLHNGKILKNESYQKMISYSITNQHSLFGESEIGYGYGLRINDKSEIFEIGHTGFSPLAGFTAVNLYYPKEKVSVVVLENQATDNFDIAYYFEQEIRKVIMQSNLVK